MKGLNLFFYAMFFSLIGLYSQASDIPSWVSALPKDEGYKFYIGRSSIAPNERQGFEEATKDAAQQAIAQNFGVRTSIQKDSYSGLTQDNISTFISEKSDQVQLYNFEQKDFFVEKIDAGFNIWVLFHYPLTAIEQEKLRLRTVKPEVQSQGLPSVVGVGSFTNSALEIVTSPSGATVVLDGVSYGLTPIIARGINPGPHSVILEHPLYIPESFEVVVSGQGTQKITKTLRVGTGRIKVSTNPTDAMIFINGQPVGQSPTKELDLAAGKKYVLEISHPEAEKLTQEVEVQRDQTRTIDLTLVLKPSFISITSTPLGADVYLDGSLVAAKTPTGFLGVKPGFHEIRVEKYGYDSKQSTFRVRGNERKTLDNINLEFLTDEDILKNKKNNDYPNRYSKAWLLLALGAGETLYSSQHGDPTSFTLGIQWNFNSIFGLSIQIASVGWKAGGNLDTKSLATNPETRAFNSNIILLGLPITIYRTKIGSIINELSLEPQIASSNNSIDHSYYSGVTPINESTSSSDTPLVLSANMKFYGTNSPVGLQIALSKYSTKTNGSFTGTTSNHWSAGFIYGFK